MARRTPVLDLIEKGTWHIFTEEDPEAPSILRLRRPVLSATETGKHRELIQVLWAYADADTGAMPSPADSDAMNAFEDRLAEAWEADGLAVVVAVLTFDGARQWIVYTSDVDECGERLNAMPQEDEPYPIELTSQHDPGWQFFHDEVLAGLEKRLTPAARNELYAR